MEESQNQTTVRLVSNKLRNRIFLTSGDSSSGSDIEEFSGIEQPPLLQQLKIILDEYRNDVQIIKELVQNADDAEATVMKILYDGRAVNGEQANEKRYRRFVRAPALAFHNDAIFSDDDWRGIRSIYSSFKRDDAMKIGRFGLGFKSVFHLTDYPCIISGKNVLFINPHERQSGKVCVTVKMKNLRKWRRLNFQDFINVMNGTFGFSEKNIDDGEYKGTIFWFPLRQTPSLLSEDVYFHKDVEGLLKAFIDESQRSLIFLKTVCSVEIYVSLPENCDSKNAHRSAASEIETDLELMNLGKETPFYVVRIDNTSNDLAEKRKEILKEIITMGDTIPSISKFWVQNSLVTVTHKTKDGNDKMSRSRWLIVNYLKGGELTERIKVLKNDKDLKYPHLVGLAAPIVENGSYSSTAGHVFCYQPLPQESSSVTGLPVHVNAFFALTQNRRHIRWPDDDNQSLTTTDKKIEWNLRLVSEILPDAYCQLVKEMVELSISENNEEYLINAVYNTIPNLKMVEPHWKDLATDVVRRCKKPEVNAIHTNSSGDWLPVQDAIIADFRGFDGLTEACINTTVELLVLDKVNICIVPNHVTDSFKTISEELTFVTPIVLRRHLTAFHSYKQMSFDQKQDLLEFVLLEDTGKDLESIELVPLSDETYCSFSNPVPVFHETKEVVEVFHGHERRFIRPFLRSKTSVLLQDVRDKGSYCIHLLTAAAAKGMLQDITATFPPTVQGSGSERVKSWIRKVWNLIQSKFRDEHEVFYDLEIFPVLAHSSWENANEIRCIAIQTHVLHIQHFSVSEAHIRKAFELLSLTVVKYVPNWIDRGLVSEYLHDDTTDGLFGVLMQLTDDNIQYFNKNCSAETSTALLEFLSERINIEIDDKLKEYLVSLKLFKAYGDASTFQFVSLKENKIFYDTKRFPVRFPQSLLMFCSELEMRFAEKLGAECISETEVALDALKHIERYSSEERTCLVNWIIKNESVFKTQLIQSQLKEVPFLMTADGRYHKVAELFDPTDKVLDDLFRGQNMIPVLECKDDWYVGALKTLGLKSRDNLTSDDINQQCDTVEEMSIGNIKFEESKCNALLKIMDEHICLVNKQILKSKRCILVRTKYEFAKSDETNTDSNQALLLKCPSDVKSKDFRSLVGTVLSTIDTKALPNLSELFGWTKPPEVADVVKQLFNVVQNYDQKHKAKSLKIVTAVYNWLKTQDQYSSADFKNIFKDVFRECDRYIWVGDGFQTPKKVYVHKKENDIDMTPFLFELSSDMKELSDFFIKLGCPDYVDLKMYLDTLEEIRNVCEADTTNKILTDEPSSKHERLLQLSVSILNKLQEDFLVELQENERELYFPIRTECSDGLRFAPSKLCTYSDDPWLQDMTDADVAEIHPKIPKETAKALGVPSLRQQLLSNTEAFEEWGQEEPLTRRLRTLLKDGYVDGFSVAKELFQNADDAGAKQLLILYDERENNDAKTQLVHENMAKCQGPAIWVYNDAQFTEDDLKNITKLSGATKEKDTTKVGKFGLGFCSVYNLTDVPSFISGENLVIFDPHTTFLGNALPGKSPGLRINFSLMKNRKVLTKMKNQFKPFEGVFDCKIIDCNPCFKGTLFRLPLRICGSEICDTVYTHSEMIELLNMIMDRSANMLLFSQNVQELKVFHLQKNQTNPSEMRLLFEVNKSVTNVVPPTSCDLKRSVLLEASERKMANKLGDPMLLLQKNLIQGKKFTDAKLQITANISFTSTWLISWATGKDEKTLQLTESEKGALCLGAVAIPITQAQNDRDAHTDIQVMLLKDVTAEFYKTGHLFFFLPLPIEHDFPFHINGQFGVTPDRRHLNWSTDDDRNTRMKDWNECLLSDPVVHALLYLLENIRSLGKVSSYKFDQLWPRSNTGQLKCICEAFYTQIVRPGLYNVFERNGEWFDITRCVLIEKTFRRSDIGIHAFDALSMLNRNVLDVSEEIYDFLYQADSNVVVDCIVTQESFFMEHFLPNLDTFYENVGFKQQSDELLSNAIHMQNIRIDNWLKSNNSIPSLPNGLRQRPNQLVDPTSQLSGMFEECEGFFPSEAFSSATSLHHLRRLGLVNDLLHDKLVTDRASSIERVKNKCVICAALRSTKLISYLSAKLSHHENCISDLHRFEFIPVAPKPNDWPFPWEGKITDNPVGSIKCDQHRSKYGNWDIAHFAKPSQVFHPDCKILVGTVRYVFEDRFFDQNDLSTLAVEIKQVLLKIGMQGITIDEVHISEGQGTEDRVSFVANPPHVNDVVLHLQNVVNNYDSKHRLYCSQIACKVYTWLMGQSQCSSKDLTRILSELFGSEDGKYIWVGDGFQPPEKVCVQMNETDIEMKPFVFGLPAEMIDLSDFFINLGCYKCIDLDMYLRILSEIHEVCETDTQEKICSDERLLKLSIEILNKLNCLYLEELENNKKEIYFPVRGESTKTGRLKLAPAKECTYCDVQWLNDINDEGIVEIHPNVPVETAEALGVPSLRQQLLSSADAFEEWGQEEPLTRRIKTLLKEGYLDGFAVAKELFQNADDAGAKKLWILYDERENNDARTHLFSENMDKCQGPAIWVYNDAHFTENDFKSITKLNGATKENDSTKIGKFGLGFCAVYNLTDVPSFISGNQLVMFDPIMTFLGKALPGKSPGLKINFRHMKNLRVIRRMKNQFKPFEGIFDCKILDCTPDFRGTLFRLPLRTNASEISDTIYTPSEVIELLVMAMNRSSNMLLFNQSIEEFKVFHLPKTENNPSKMKLLFEVTKSNMNLLPKSCEKLRQSVLEEASEMKHLKKLYDPLLLLQKNTITGTIYCDSQLHHKEAKHFTNTWLISWATGADRQTIEMTESEKGAICLGAIAVPIDYCNTADDTPPQLKVLPLCDVDENFYTKGHVFFFLPLPIEHNFPFHINGQFVVTPDRRHLNSSTEDDKNQRKNDWNERLLSDPIIFSLLHLLEKLHTLGDLSTYRFDQLWPLSEKRQLLKSVPEAFYRQVVRPGIFKIFEKDGKWFDISQCVFIEQTFRRSPLGEIAFQLLSMLNNNVVDISEDVYLSLKMADINVIMERTVTEHDFFMKYFLPNLRRFDENTDLKAKRDKMLSHAICCSNSEIHKWMTDNPCIPSRPSGVLRKPSDLIDPKSMLVELFEDSDGYFLDQCFTSTDIVEKLKPLGLINQTLPDALLVQRVNSIKPLEEKCKKCAADRASLIIIYLSTTLSQHENCVDELKQINFVPVSSKPFNWPFTWKGQENGHKSFKVCEQHSKDHCNITTSHFEKASEVYRYDCKYIVGCVKYVFDERQCLRNKHHVSTMDINAVLQQIGVNGFPERDIDHGIVIEQLHSLLATDFTESLKVRFEKTLTAIYGHLNEKCKDMVVFKSIQSSLHNKKCVWVNDRFVSSEIVAKFCARDCQPFLFQLQSPLAQYGKLCECLNIVDHFHPHMVGMVIGNLKVSKGEEKLTAEEVTSAISLLHCLDQSLTFHEIDDVDSILDAQLLCIYGPDEDGILRNCKLMCFNDHDNIEKSESMIYTHVGIPPSLAIKFGVIPKVIFNLEENSEDIEDFYPDEPLVIRLKRLVESYPCDSGIFKELIQNADDAYATEIHFLLDEITHPCDNIMNPEFEPLQGPALCVFNNSAFSNKDLEGIRRLGVGSKGDDPSKTGSYGVGFNSVYNITDAPSFYTIGGDIENGETLCLFDPLAKYVPRVTRKKPGKRYKNVDKIKRHHSNVMDGYHTTFFLDKQDKGTIFRFPLRTIEMAMDSEIKSEAVDVTNIKQYLENLYDDAKDMMVFLKTLRTIKVSKASREQYDEFFRVDIELGEVFKLERAKFVDLQSTFFSQAKSDKERILSYKQLSFAYELSITGKCSNTLELTPCTKTTNYTVVQTLGFKDQKKVPQLLKDDLVKGKIGFMPHGAVALCSTTPLPSITVPPEAKNKVYCFLPLPIHTGLPVHVHGYFALEHEGRRSLFRGEKPEECSKSLWNSTLIRQVISPAYVLLLEYIRRKVFAKFSNDGFINYSVVHAVKMYQQLFPVWDNVSDEYWKELLRCVFNELVSEHIPFLPVLRTTCKERKYVRSQTVKMTEITWTPLNHPELEFPAFLISDLNFVEESRKEDFEFSNLLGDIGMRIVSCIPNIRIAMDHACCAIQQLKPSHTIHFLTSFSSDNKGKCSIEVNKHIGKTVVRSSGNLMTIVRYCLNDIESFMESLERLPLFMTQDFVLRTLPEGGFYYLDDSGSFCDFFPTKLHLFLQSDLARLTGHSFKCFEKSSTNKLKPFNLQDFVHLASDTGAIPTNTIQNKSWDKNDPDVSWIQKFWRFFFHVASESDNDDISSLLQIIQNCALIPAFGSNEVSVLVPPINRKAVINKGSFRNSATLQRSISSLNIPTLDVVVFPEEQYSSLKVCKMLLSSQIPNFSIPEDVVECFHINRSAIIEAGISQDCATTLMMYFNDTLGTTGLSGKTREIIQNLPFFVSRFGCIVAISKFEKKYVVPNNLPQNGLEDLANNVNTLLLQDINCMDLYCKLDITKLSLVDVYTKLIIPYQNKMKRKDFYAHISFIAKISSYESGYMDSKLLHLLKPEKFVLSSCGNMKCVAELFDPKNKIFLLMCQPSELVPTELRDPNTLMLFRQLGMKTSLDLKLFERFAEDLHKTEQDEGLSSNVQNKSLLLTKELFEKDEHFFQRQSLVKLSEKAFVLPFKPTVAMEEIHQARNDSRLICLKGSVLESKKYNCWTVSNILSFEIDKILAKATKADVIIDALKIERKPLVQDLLNHFRNVSRSVSIKAKSPSIYYHDSLQSIMGSIYEALDEYRRSNTLTEPELQFLSNIATIYIPTIKQIFAASAVVIECKQSKEIPPYLNMCPRDFKNYKDLFLLLGVRKELSCDVFASVLGAIRSKCRPDGFLLPNEKADCLKAMALLFNLLAKFEGDVKITEKTLYLVTSDFKLQNARNLVAINDRVLYKKILENYTDGGLSFLLESNSFNEYHKIKANKEQYIENLKKLPKRQRPRILTDIVRSRIVLDGIQIKDSAPAKELETFVHSSLFLNGFVRLVRHSWEVQEKKWSVNETTRIVSHLRKISFINASGIKTVTVLKMLVNEETEDEVVVPNLEDTKIVHLEDNGKSVCVYFDFQSIQWFEHVQKHLCVHLSEFVENCFQSNKMFVLHGMIGMIKTPGKILDLLSTEDIPEYDIEIETDGYVIYPTPGTFVPRHLHHYLENDFGIFYHYEYKFVAMELEDPALDDLYENEEDEKDTSVSCTYIFVHILEKVHSDNRIPLLQEYKIDNGSGTPLVVKAYQLYKFIAKCKSDDTCENGKADSRKKSVVLYERRPDDENTQPKVRPLPTLYNTLREIRTTLLEAWKQPEDIRKRIVKRLLLKWHPDKNPDNILFCTKVFQYIQQCLQRLERGLGLPEVTEDETDNGSSQQTQSSSSSSSWNWDSSFYGRYWQRSRYYEDNYRSGSGARGSSFYDYYGPRSSRSSGFNSSSGAESYQWYTEARRWQRQAKSDFVNGRGCFLDTPVLSPNWSCYILHQAAEKSLKAAWYAKNANKIHSVMFSHDIVSIASGLGPELASLAGKISSILGEHTRMRYPFSGQPIPADSLIYTRTTVETVLKLTEQIIDKVQRDFIRQT